MTLALADIDRCFQGEIPSLLATCSATGVPNLAHLSQVFLVDADHVATSNQFLSKTAANLAENPVASLMCIDPKTMGSFRVLVHWERSESEGPLFDEASASIEAIASLTGMAGVFSLRAIDVFRVLDVAEIEGLGAGPRFVTDAHELGALVALGDRLAAACSLEEVIDAALAGVEELLGHRHSLLLVHQPDLERLVTLASRGHAAGGIGSEVTLDEGVIGMVGARRRPMRIGNLQRMLSYARAVRESSGEPTEREIRLPGLADARSQLAAPMVARGVLVGVLAVESSQALAYDEHDEQILTVAAHLVAAALEREQVAEAEPEPAAPAESSADAVTAKPPAGVTPEPAAAPGVHPTPVTLRHYAVDGSTFIGDDYLIKGVAGRLLWKVAAEHEATGRTSFTNREAKLDPALELPTYRDNFESRLILLKRRLDEREAPLRITSSGRGRFDLEMRARIVLEHIART